MDFDGQGALVTGGSRGIGRAIAAELARRGARVAVHFNQDARAAEATVSELLGDGHVALRADLGDTTAAPALVEAAIEALGRIDVLVNNAGIFVEHPPLQVEFERWREAWVDTISVNLVGPAHLCYAAARHMVAAGGGRIVNVSSRGAFRGEPDAPAYGASKAGLNALSQSLAKALAPHGVYVTVVAPGWVETDMAAEHLASAEGDAIRAQSPLNRVAKPEEVARAVAFLATPGSEFLTGCVLDVNGASYLRT